MFTCGVRQTRCALVTGVPSCALPIFTSGRIARLAIVYAVTDPQAGKKGISAFLVPTDRPGYSGDKVEHKLGQGASDTCAIRFDNLFVEDELRLGAAGQG